MIRKKVIKTSNMIIKERIHLLKDLNEEHKHASKYK
jgi:hypothetical protein